MAVSTEIREAVKRATKKYGQKEQLSTRILSWLEELASGEALQTPNKDDINQRIETILGAVSLTEENSAAKEENNE